MVTSTAKRVGNNGRGPVQAAKNVNGAALVQKSKPGAMGVVGAAVFQNAAASMQALGEETKNAAADV